MPQSYFLLVNPWPKFSLAMHVLGMILLVVLLWAWHVPGWMWAVFGALFLQQGLGAYWAATHPVRAMSLGLDGCHVCIDGAWVPVHLRSVWRIPGALFWVTLHWEKRHINILFPLWSSGRPQASRIAYALYWFCALETKHLRR